MFLSYERSLQPGLVGAGEAGVLVCPGHQLGASGGGHFRLCYARDEAEWTLALDRMVVVLNGLARRHGLPEKAA
jgi:bifunctional pyridoxal-dependent enzyme with beta-cystathionase and maltose regulon repressor activities